MGPDCNTLFITGYTADGIAGFVHDVDRGAAERPSCSPVRRSCRRPDSTSTAKVVAWVMDHLAVGDDGEGVLFSVDAARPTEVASDLRMGTPGGVSLTAGGGTAVMPTLDHDGHAQLTSVDIDSGELITSPLQT